MLSSLSPPSSAPGSRLSQDDLTAFPSLSLPDALTFGEPLNGEDDHSSDSAMSKEDMDHLIADLQDDDEGDDVQSEDNAPVSSRSLKTSGIPSLSFSVPAFEGGDAVPEPLDPATWLEFPVGNVADGNEEQAGREEESSDSDDDDEQDGNIEEEEGDEASSPTEVNSTISPKRPAVEDADADDAIRSKKRLQVEGPKIIPKPSLNEDSAVASFILSPWT